MKILNKQQVEEKIGKNSLWSLNKFALGCSYLAGIDELDKIIYDRSLSSLPIVGFRKHPMGIILAVSYRFKNYSFALHDDEITRITFEPGKAFAEKEKSVVGRAIVGGLLFGPIGAMIGGASGIGSKILKDQDSLLINAIIDGQEMAILFKVEKGKAAGVVKFFQDNYRLKFDIL